MAFTITTLGQNVLGPGDREVILKVATDATSGAVKTGLRWVESIDVSQEQGTDRQVDVYPNAASATTTESAASGGTFFLNNCANGTTYRFLVCGK